MRLGRASRARVASAALALAACLAACRRAPPASASVRVAGPAVLGRPARVSAEAPGAAGAEAGFTADMDMPGMAPVVARATETAPGRFEADLSWTMAGDWTVLFSARSSDGRRAEGRAAVRVAPR